MSVTSAHPAQPTEATGQDTKLWLLMAAKVVVVFIYAFALLNLVMLILGFFLQLFGASTDADFTRWVYRSVDRIMDPFRGVFPSHALSDQSVLDVSLLFAIIVYVMVGIALHALVVWLTDKIIGSRLRQGVSSGRDEQLGEPAVPPAGPPRATGYPASQLPPEVSAGPGTVNR